MNEFELYKRILSPRLIANSQTTLVEDKVESRKHHCDIIDECVDEYVVYRYDMDEKRELFMPFFYQFYDLERGDGENRILKGLLEFCDYIIIASKSNRLYVVLIEMKSGKNNRAEKQIEATKTFMDFVCSTAERIKSENDYEEFSRNNITYRRVVLKPVPKVRPVTNKAKSACGRIDWDASVIHMSSSTLPLHQLCK